MRLTKLSFLWTASFLFAAPRLTANAAPDPRTNGDTDLTTITLTSPIPGIVIPDVNRHEKVTFGAIVMIPPDVNPWVRLTITCKEGPGSIVREPNRKGVPIVREEVTVGDLLDLAPGAPAGTVRHIRWKLDASDQRYKEGDKYYFSTASSEFTIAGPANLALSVESDFGSPWPKKIVVRNAGGSRSQPSSLEVDFRLRDVSDPAVKSRCPAMDFHKVHTVLGLGPNEKIDFDVPKPANALQSKPPGGTHKVVTCNYELDAGLAGDTNKQDPNARNNRIQKVVSVDIPLN